MYGLRNDTYATLHVPTENDLCHRFIVFFRNAFQYRIGKHAVHPFGERRPRLRHDAVLAQNSQFFFPLVERMQFQLVHHRLDFRRIAEVDVSIRR